VTDPKCDATRGQTRLGRVEYQIPKRVVDTSGLGEGEFRIFKKISGLEEMRESVEAQHEEVYQLYEIAESAQASSSYVTISQQQMLLLALYYLRETMYLGVKA